MNAQEARKLTNDYNDPKLQQVLHNIKLKAMSGSCHLNVYEYLSANTVDILRSLGYQLYHTEDQNLPAWTISW
jgi:hypothetical protein